jgi:DNA uptake protein ComE-like DNA-binding protein
VARISPEGATADEVQLVVAALAVALVLVAVSLPGSPAAPRRCVEPRLLPTADDAPAVVCDAAQIGLPSVRGPVRLLFGEALDLNRAPAHSLEVLPGIGPRRAAAIVTERRTRRFESVEGLQRVPGIGPRTVARLVGWVDVSNSAGGSDADPEADGSRSR